MSREVDLDFMKTPDNWPAWPFCPVKRQKDSDLEVGLLVHDAPEVRTRVLLANLWWDDSSKAEAPVIEYPDWEALQDAGWVVD